MPDFRVRRHRANCPCTDWNSLGTIDICLAIAILLGVSALVAGSASEDDATTAGQIKACWVAENSPYLALAAGAAGAFLLIWLAGTADRAVLEQGIRQRDATLHAMGEELLRMKSTAYDQVRPPLADIRARLETMERDLATIRAHLGESPPVIREREVPAGDRRPR